jgi:hypothetical protein
MSAHVNTIDPSPMAGVRKPTDAGHGLPLGECERATASMINLRIPSNSGRQGVRSASRKSS